MILRKIKGDSVLSRTRSPSPAPRINLLGVIDLFLKLSLISTEKEIFFLHWWQSFKRVSRAIFIIIIVRKLHTSYIFYRFTGDFFLYFRINNWQRQINLQTSYIFYQTLQAIFFILSNKQFWQRQINLQTAIKF